MIPTTSWEAIWNAVCLWFGVEEEDMDVVLPNRHNFVDGHLFTKDEIYWKD